MIPALICAAANWLLGRHIVSLKPSWLVLSLAVVASLLIGMIAFPWGYAAVLSEAFGAHFGQTITGAYRWSLIVFAAGVWGAVSEFRKLRQR